MKSRTSVAVLLCVALAFAHSSPTGKKNSQSKKAELEKEINPSSSKTLGDDDLLAREKKSSTTTFCVEIKPGTDQPAVVVCDPANNNQQPLPTPPPAPAPPPPAHQPEPQPDPGYFQYPQFIPDYPQLVPQIPLNYDPLQILVPQVPQIVSQFPQQPQIIFVRDPSCPSNNPGIIPSPWQQSLYPGLAYPPRTFGRSAGGYPISNGQEFWKSGLTPEEDQIRSFAGANGLSSAGYLSSLDAIYSKRGLVQPNSQSPYDKPFLIQCNPSVVPLPQNYNSAASAAGAANFDPIKLRNAITENVGKYAMDPAQFMHQPMPGTNGMYMSQGAMPYMRQSTTNNGDQYRSSAFSPLSRTMEAAGTGPMMSEANPLDRATEHIQGLLKSRHESQSSLGDQEQQVSTDARDSKAMTNEQAQKIESAQSAQSVAENQNMGRSSVAQGGFVPNSGSQQLQAINGNDQGFQRQITLSAAQQPQQLQHLQHLQQQQQQQQQQLNGAARNGGAELKNYQQPLTSNEQRLQMMKAAVNQNNMVQPYMIQGSHLVGEKQMPLKV